VGGTGRWLALRLAVVKCLTAKAVILHLQGAIGGRVGKGRRMRQVATRDVPGADVAGADVVDEKRLAQQ
jgi:hypothetical protein